MSYGTGKDFNFLYIDRSSKIHDRKCNNRNGSKNTYQKCKPEGKLSGSYMFNSIENADELEGLNIMAALKTQVKDQR